MNASRLLFLFLSIALVLPLFFSTFLGASDADKDSGDDSVIKYVSVFTDVLRLVREVYVEEPDMDRLMAGAMDGASDALDPFSVFLPKGRIEPFLAAQEIGAGHSGMVMVRERGVAYVVTVHEGSPADVAGVKRADIVSKLQGRSSRNMPMWDLVGIMAGKPGTEVELELVRRGATVDVTFELGEFTPPAPRLEERRGVEVLRIPSFSSATVESVKRSMGNLKKDKLVLDLRGAAGGDPELGYNVAESFVAGELGALVSSQGPLKSFESKGSKPWRGDVVVLIDRGSQGPAEVLASVLRQSAEAEVVGETSFGFAGRHKLVKLSSGAALQITDGFYTGPDQEPLNEGLVPDHVVHRQVFNDDGEPSDEDPMLERAVEVLLGEEESVAEKAA